MRLAVFESTGFFGTQVGQSVEKTYTIRSDCTVVPCVLKLAVSGTPGEFDLRRQPDEYVLAASGPQDCIDLATGALAGAQRRRGDGDGAPPAHVRDPHPPGRLVRHRPERVGGDDVRHHQPGLPPGVGRAAVDGRRNPPVTS